MAALTESLRELIAEGDRDGSRIALEALGKLVDGQHASGQHGSGGGSNADAGDDSRVREDGHSAKRGSSVTVLDRSWDRAPEPAEIPDSPGIPKEPR